MFASFLSLITAALLFGPAAALSILQDDRRAIFVDLSRCPHPKAAQPNIQTIASSPTFDTSLCGLRDTSDFCSQAANAQIAMKSSADGKSWTFRVPQAYDSINLFVWMQEQSFPQFWNNPQNGVVGTLIDLQKDGVSSAHLQKGLCPNGRPCHRTAGFKISSVYFQTQEGGVIGSYGAGVTTSSDPYERLVIEYC
ncbi:hypothetical protein GTA08_BOTSDO09633 [Botryosphaeria dothidea]|uniref:Uncharacterized protein n=1 Tax=Botryosphaeria dothidea TaxID=55169 RepID=A0A8H4IL63_9PEZI|nr:hypothetical protein GTA08_BOTSDO09633 [Botryosphaeria dothidea]